MCCAREDTRVMLSAFGLAVRKCRSAPETLFDLVHFISDVHLVRTLHHFAPVTITVKLEPNMLEDFADFGLVEKDNSHAREDRMRIAFEKSKQSYSQEQVFTEPEVSTLLLGFRI